jgi:hypothetical protein
MRTQDELHRMTRDVLGDGYVELSVGRYTLTENIDEQSAWIVCQLVQRGKGPLCAVEGRGVGFIDALFHGLRTALARDYPSLEHIHFVDFMMSGDFNGAADDGGAHTEVPGLVRLVVENAARRRFEFERTSPSVSASSVRVVVQAAEHFVNAELAVLKVFDWLEDARRRSRPDLVEKYTHMLAELVQNATYSESIERRKKAVQG